MFVLLGLVGCAEGAPPFDELPLRDVLAANPEAIAELPPPARAKLAQRFERARASDESLDQTNMDSLPARTREDRIERARRSRNVEALIVGMIDDRAAWPIRDRVEVPGVALPALDGAAAGPSAELETQALAGKAGPVLRGLFAASGARRLQRVIGWPAAAVAIDETVYVNAAWLVSLSADDTDTVDGGIAMDSSADSSASNGTQAASGTAGGTISPRAPVATGTADPVTAKDFSGSSPYEYSRDAGAWSPPPNPYGSSSSSPEPDPAAAADACATCADACGSCADACASGDGTDSGTSGDGTVDSTDGCSAANNDPSDSGPDGCNTATSDGSDACAAPADAGDGAAACRMGRPRSHGSSTREAWLLAPLLFLVTRRQS